MFSPEAQASTLFGETERRPAWRFAPRTELLIILAVIGLQIAILASMIVLDGLPLWLGQRIRLAVEPVDPRDLFRGDYVVLGYEYSRFSLERITGLTQSELSSWYDRQLMDREVFVALHPAGDRYAVAGVSTQRPATHPYLRGKIRWPGRVQCGIEAYYVQEGEGRRLEDAIRNRRLQAEVAVWRGYAKLVRLIE